MKKTGELLKKAREDRGLSLHEVALFLKINSRVLQAIEDGDQASLPARTFLRGFVQSYAKFLKLESAIVLQVFNEEMAPVNPSPSIQVAQTIIVEKDPPAESLKKELSESSEEKSLGPNLEKSILAKSQVTQDRLSSKTIAFSVLGLLLVVLLIFANSVVKKYKKEAEVTPVQSVTEKEVSIPEDSSLENQSLTVAVSAKSAPITEEKIAPQQNSTHSTPTATHSTAAATTSVTPSASQPPMPATPSGASNQTVSTPAMSSAGPSGTTPTVSPSPEVEKNVVEMKRANEAGSSSEEFSFSNFFFETKPKLPQETGSQPVSKSQTVAMATATTTTSLPTTGASANPSATPTPSTSNTTTSADKKEELKVDGKHVEVIVEATDAVEIEYSSSRTVPQKMILKADQIHTFKSRSGVRLKISNGGAVNIIMNGRDLGAPGAAGQPVQVTY